MKKYISGFIFLICVFTAAITASAGNNVSDIDINAVIRSDGSAYVSQIWKGTFNSGTENYIPIKTGDINITGLSVSDQNGKYENAGSWDTNAGFNDKARKCGINKTASGVELCFGISQYGQNTYTIEYTINNFIKSYSDYDGTNFMFVNTGMNTFPSNGKINISVENGTKLDENNAGIWAFGFEGNIEFSGGKITAYTSRQLTGDNSMIVLLKLNKGIIHPAVSLNKSFEDVKAKAMEGSSYDESDGSIPLWIKIAALVIALIILLIALFLIKRQIAIKKFYKSAPYFRDIPNNGKLEVSHFLAQNFDVAGEKSLIIGAVMLSMINNNFIEPQSEESAGFFGKTKTSVSLKLIKEPEKAIEKNLYNIIYGAAGEDGILQEKELKTYAGKYPEMLEEFVKNAEADGEIIFLEKGGFVNGSGNCIKDLSESGKAELAEIMGLKKFLNDFSLISEREIKETVIWKDYLVYATLFGIADATIKQFKKIYPDMVQEIEECNRNVIIAGSYYNTMYYSYHRALEAKRNSGGGGFSSIGGGGGFSGGGSGGGSR